MKPDQYAFVGVLPGHVVELVEEIPRLENRSSFAGFSVGIFVRILNRKEPQRSVELGSLKISD